MKRLSFPPSRLTRREWLKLTTAGAMSYSMSGWLEALANGAATDPKGRRACILLWMNGGPSHMDTFDLKPGHANGGPFKAIDTSVPGMQVSEHLPKVAKLGQHLAIVRSMSTKEADHGRATYTMRTGHAPGGPIQYPALGALVAKELEPPDAELPGFASIGPSRFLSPGAYGPGFLGPRYAPLVVGENAANGGGQQPDQALRVQALNLPAGVSLTHAAARVQLLDEMEEDFLAERSGVASLSHRTAYQRALTMIRSPAAKAFNLDEESKELRDRYGRNLFGQGCLLARRLVERGVPFVEVNLGGWDTHQSNFTAVQRLSEVLDTGWSTLLEDLKDRGLVESTLIVWMGEFGRTPKINNSNGRDHWANSWSTVLAGGGIRGGQVIGKTGADGMAVEERPVSVRDFLATVCLALGIDITKQNPSNVGRPIRIVEPGAQPIKEVLA
jgi:uncharacterized protein (DUF1501 family)